MASTWVIAHRGASADFPENTGSAFQAAIRQGCDAIELDVQMTRDGVVVVWHDRTLTKAGGGRRRVSNVDYADLARLDAAARWPQPLPRQPILRLDDVLRRFGRRTRLLVEIKARSTTAAAHNLELARLTAKAIRSAGQQRRAMVLCFDPKVLDEVQRTASGLRRVLNLRPPRRLSAALRRQLGDLHMLSANVKTLTPAFGQAVVAAGTPLMTYTCNTTRHVERALAAGVRGIMSDRPSWLRGQLDDRKARENS